MTEPRETRMPTDLMRARIRLGMLARTAQLNMEEAQEQCESTEVMQTILAASALEEDS